MHASATMSATPYKRACMLAGPVHASSRAFSMFPSPPLPSRPLPTTNHTNTVSPFAGNWLQVMADHQAINCALHTAPPKWPQANVDVCCDPPNDGFGCDYTGLAGGRFNDTSGALADVIPFTHVGGWPGDPSWMLAGVTVNWENAMKSGDLAFATAHYATSKALIDFMSRHVGTCKAFRPSFTSPLLVLSSACTMTLPWHLRSRARRLIACC